ncbi:hypothetical protein [Roseibium sp.]|uniref:hypothetical protein n=1 Tax=Roseibium sp. TaxID=1936156 RepID=UPI003A96A793
MNRQEIIAHLADRSRLPWHCLSTCLRDPERSTPLFLLLLERKCRELPLSDEEDKALFFAIHVLGAQGAQEAFAPLKALLCRSPHSAAALVGDAIADTVPQILMAFGPHLSADCWDVAVSPDCDWLVREAFLRCWTYHMLRQDVPAGIVADRLRDFPAEAQLRPDSFLWTAWLTAIADLGLEELLPDVEDALQNGTIEIGALALLPSDIDGFREDLQQAKHARTVPARFAAWREQKSYVPFSGSHEDFVRAGRHIVAEVHATDEGHLRAAERAEPFDENK